MQGAAQYDTPTDSKALRVARAGLGLKTDSENINQKFPTEQRLSRPRVTQWQDVEDGLIRS